MARLQLVIGNKNYSSWSLRAYMALVEFGISFDERLIPFGPPRFGRSVRKLSKAARVPILIDGETVIWDSLAILEYLAERYPDRQMWPVKRAARAMARSVSAEMHAGFQAMRQAYPMNMHRPEKKAKDSEAVRQDIARIEELWRDCRKTHGKGGAFLFGRFSLADAMYAPVVSRLLTYAVPVKRDTKAYMTAVADTKAFQDWKRAALLETWLCLEEEVP